jgi:hypothetical protein
MGTFCFVYLNIPKRSTYRECHCCSSFTKITGNMLFFFQNLRARVRGLLEFYMHTYKCRSFSSILRLVPSEIWTSCDNFVIDSWMGFLHSTLNICDTISGSFSRCPAPWFTAYWSSFAKFVNTSMNLVYKLCISGYKIKKLLTELLYVLINWINVLSVF